MFVRSRFSLLALSSATVSFWFLASTASAQSTGKFTAVGSMSGARFGHTTTLLNNGKVLVTGGLGPTSGGIGSVSTAELYDPATGSFRSLSNMTSARLEHAAITLPNGKVLITGGTLNAVNGVVTYLNSAELFDPATENFTALAPMNTARVNHSATLLPNGKVLLAGGDRIDRNGTNDTAELFDPATGTFALIANTMTEARSYHTATVLQNGKVLIAGGGHLNGVLTEGTNTAELFDPATQAFTATGVLSSIRYEHTATLLPNGKVVLIGGTQVGDIPVVGAVPTVTNVSRTADLFDPATGTFTEVSPGMMSEPRTGHTAALLPNGKVLIAGGYNGGPAGPNIGAASWLNTAELFDPSSNLFSLVANTMTSARALHTAAILADSRVILIGGSSGSAFLSTAELADFSAGSFAAVQPMATARYYHSSTPLSDGRILIAGGTSDTQVTIGAAELFNPATGTFTSAGNTMTSPRYAHTATLLANGKVLIAAGLAGATVGDLAPTDAAELFDPDTSTFTAISSMTSKRAEHATTLLPNGKVLITGGWRPTTYLKSAELFDPNTGEFRALAQTMSIERTGHSATVLANGKVLIAGGNLGLASLTGTTAEIFDPVTETFTPLTSTLNVPRVYHTATLLPSGKVLLAGGYSTSTQPYYTETTELFDPATNTFTPGPSMSSRRVGHTATLLSSGKVLIAGGLTTVQVPPSNLGELFDPATGTFASLLPNTMTSFRQSHSATLLPNGQVLIAGGFDGNNFLNTAEVFDAGLGFSDARRPVIANATDPLVMPASLIVSGSGFRGDSEATGGPLQGSSTNYPVVQLMRIDNDQVFFPLSDPATNWSDSTFSSQIIGATDTLLPKGRYRVTVFTNGIPSIQKMIEINGTIVPQVPLTSVVSRKAHGDVAVFDVPLPVTGPVGIECRSGGATGNYTLIFTFATELSSVDQAEVTSGVGNVASKWINADTHQYVVNLTGVTNVQVITVSLSNVADSIGNFSLVVVGQMGVLLGDVNASGNVDSADVGQVQRQNNKPLTTSNFRMDVNVSGNIDAADVGQVQRQNSKHL